MSCRFAGSFDVLRCPAALRKLETSPNCGAFGFAGRESCQWEKFRLAPPHIPWPIAFLIASLQRLKSDSVSALTCMYTCDDVVIEHTM